MDAETPATADLMDRTDGSVQTFDVQFRDLGGRRRFGGPIRTVRCHEDNALVRQVLATPGEGAVLVVDGGGSLHTALIGDVIASLAVEHGWSGVIVHGAVRDSVALSQLPLGVKALGVNPRRSGKAGTGAIDVAVTIGGVVLRPGLMVAADEDGVVVYDA